MAKLIKGVNDLETYCKQNGREDLLAEWHPTRNDTLKPSDVTSKSGQKVWWLLHHITDDGKAFNFEWKATIENRVKGSGCPYLCSNPKVWKGFNDLETYCKKNGREDLLEQWHPVKNDSLTPDCVTWGSTKKVFWCLPYTDKKTGKQFAFEWKAIVQDRVKGKGCPYLSGQAVWRGFNDFETYCKENEREDLLEQWHPSKNYGVKPSDITWGSHKKVFWLLPYDDKVTGKHFDFEWEAIIVNRVQGTGCPYLSSNPLVWKGFNDLATTHPEIAREWHPTKNGDLKVTEVRAGSNYKVWWYLPYTDANGRVFEFEWQATVASRTSGRECPFISNPPSEVWEGFNDLETYCKENGKEYLLQEWHTIKNGTLKAKDVTAHSGKCVWWLLHYIDTNTGKYFDFEW